MFANARQYNMEGSDILQDVDAMEVSAAAFVSLHQSHRSCSYLRFPLEPEQPTCVTLQAAMMQHLVALAAKQPRNKSSQQVPLATDNRAEPWNQPAAEVGHGGDAMSQYADDTAGLFNDDVDGEGGHTYGNDMADDYSNPYGIGDESSAGRSKLVLKRKR